MPYMKYHNHCGDQSVRNAWEAKRCVPRASFPAAVGREGGERKSTRASLVSFKIIKNAWKNEIPLPVSLSKNLIR
jgi:hypothetical protein